MFLSRKRRLNQAKDNKLERKMTAFVPMSSSCHAIVTPTAEYPFDTTVCAMSPVPVRGTLSSRIAEHTAEDAAAQCRRSHPELNELALRLDAERAILWQYMQPKSRPSFTTGLLADMNAALDWVSEVSRGSHGDNLPVRYLVLASRVPGTFNLGGDLALFMRAIEERDAATLRRYARACIGVQYRRASNLSLPIGTIALVQGDALGGGFEAALAHEVIIAERQAKFGLPEVLFNLFPGMGALSFLSRRMPPAQAERMVLSGRVYTADENIYAGYGMVDVPVSGAVRVIGGLRVERWELDVETLNTFGTPILASPRKTDFLPSVSVNWAFRPEMMLRFAATQTVSRPEYRELSPVPYFEQIGLLTTFGNPDLNRALVRNVDARWEWYPRAGEVVSAGVFAKFFDDPIVRHPARAWRGCENLGSEEQAAAFRRGWFRHPSSRAATPLSRAKIPSSTALWPKYCAVVSRTHPCCAAANR